jgi:hypothetical protein
MGRGGQVEMLWPAGGCSLHSTSLQHVSSCMRDASCGKGIVRLVRREGEWSYSRPS